MQFGISRRPFQQKRGNKLVHFLGVDIGSAASKAVAVNEEGEILASAAVQLGTGTKGVQSAVETLYAESALDPADSWGLWL